MVLLVEVFVLDLFVLFDRGVNELLVQYYNTAFAHCLEYDILFTRLLRLHLYVFESLELHVVHFDLLGKLKNYRLVEHFSVAVCKVLLLTCTLIII